jgi:hypothetical protein
MQIFHRFDDTIRSTNIKSKVERDIRSRSFYARQMIQRGGPTKAVENEKSHRPCTFFPFQEAHHKLLLGILIP